MFAINKSLLLPDGSPPPQLLAALLSAQEEQCKKRLNKLHDCYQRKHSILGRKRARGLPNNRLVHDYPGYIVSVSSGYLVGEPVRYTLQDAPEAFVTIQDALDRSDCASVDAELAVDAAVYGKAVELCYADGKAQPRLAQIDPRRSFVVYDDTVAHEPLFGVTSNDVLDANLRKTDEQVHVYTGTEHITYVRKAPVTPVEQAREAHYFGTVPMTEYWNNAQEAGDFEPVLTLIDAYDTLQSDRVNDKQQFTDAIMVLKGVGSLGADEAEVEPLPPYDGEGVLVRPEQPLSEEPMTPSERLRQTKTLFLPADGADAGFITKPDAESGNELLRQSAADDIHKFSFVPDLTDEKFSGDTSGVAMRFKLFGLEQLTKIKERWFREGLRRRLVCLANFLGTKGMAAVDVDAVQITFSRSLPVNDLEIAQTVQAYEGIVPLELLLSHIPWVDDPQAAMAMLEAQKAEELKRQQQTFARYDSEQDAPGVPNATDKRTDEPKA